MLDSMMSSSGLPLAEQRRLRAAVDAGPSAQIVPRKKPLPVGRHPKFQDPLRGVPINPHIARRFPGGGGRMAQSDILRAHGGSLEREQFRGSLPATSSEVKREELANLMTYGTKQLPTVSHGRESVRTSSTSPRAIASSDAALRDAIVDEIADRQTFLETMRQHGKGAEHESRINGEIAERLQDLKRVDQLIASEQNGSR